MLRVPSSRTYHHFYTAQIGATICRRIIRIYANSMQRARMVSHCHGQLAPDPACVPELTPDIAIADAWHELGAFRKRRDITGL